MGIVANLLFLKWEVHEGLGCDMGTRQKWWIFDTCQAKGPLSNLKGRPGRILSQGVSDIDVSDNCLQETRDRCQVETNPILQVKCDGCVN